MHPPEYMASESRSISPEKPQDSRDEILKAGIRLFARRGFHETSMSEVARDAKVSKALIFWHFKTKEELFLAVLNRLLEPYFIDFAEEVGALDERAQLRKLVQSYLLFVRDNAASVRFFLGQLLHGEKVPEELATQVMKLYDGFLFAGGTADELDRAVTMLEEWLFRDPVQRSSEGGKAVA